MFASLGKTVTAGALALTIAVTSLGASATPARANGDEAAAIFGGLLALFAISRAIDIHNSRQGQAAAQPAPQQPHRPVIQPVQPRQLVAPAQCRREFQTANGVFRGYNQRCMQRNVARPERLPENCIRQVRTQNGIRNFYAGRCLHRNGWVRG